VIIRHPGKVAARLQLRSRELPNGCREWIGARHPSGYGVIRIDGKNQYAHRVAFVLAGGVLDDKLVLDHLKCDYPPCIRADHLAQVTQGENVARNRLATATHCKRHHEWTDENTYRDPKGHRRCRACRAGGYRT
jgi:hypothetical protein